MNKDVINIAPEDDITDILAHLKNATQKIVALVLPQPAGIFRSAVNIKLIAKTAEDNEKVPVLVTSDPAVLKLAMTAHIPVAESLQSRPSVPTEDDLNKITPSSEKEAEIAEDFVKPPQSAEEIVDSDEVESEISGEEKKAEETTQATEESDQKFDDEEKTGKKSKIAEKFPWIYNNRKILIISGSVLVVAILFCVWAFVFAPAVDVEIAIRTSSNNFSENVSFTNVAEAEDSESGKFYLQEEKFETESKVEFKATGKKDIGEKASGSLEVSVFFNNIDGGKLNIPSGTVFSNGDLKYTSVSDATISWDGESLEDCENEVSKLLDFRLNGCERSGTVPIVATAAGENYNVDSDKTKWSAPLAGTAVKSISIKTSGAIAGGTSKIVTVVQQSDVNTAKEKLSSSNETDGKETLKEKISDTVLALWDTYAITTSDAQVTPAVGEVVEENVTPTIKTTAKYSVYTVDLVRIEEFISSRATLGDDQKIYDLGGPFVEYFNGSDGNYTGKLKTTFYSGPKITDSEIVEKIKGRKVGEAQSLLKSINGVNSVKINPSFFWVNNVPNDTNKISVDIKVEE